MHNGQMLMNKISCRLSRNTRSTWMQDKARIFEFFSQTIKLPPCYTHGLTSSLLVHVDAAVRHFLFTGFNKVVHEDSALSHPRLCKCDTFIQKRERYCAQFHWIITFPEPIL